MILFIFRMKTAKDWPIKKYEMKWTHLCLKVMTLPLVVSLSKFY